MSFTRKCKTTFQNDHKVPQYFHITNEIIFFIIPSHSNYIIAIIGYHPKSSVFSELILRIENYIMFHCESSQNAHHLAHCLQGESFYSQYLNGKIIQRQTCFCMHFSYHIFDRGFCEE